MNLYLTPESKEKRVEKYVNRVIFNQTVHLNQNIGGFVNSTNIRHDEMIQLNKEMIQLNKEMIKLNKEMIKFNKETIKLNKETIKLNKEMVGHLKTIAEKEKKKFV